MKKKFILKTLLFLTPIICIYIGTEYYVRQIPNNYSFKNEYLDTFAKDIEVLILGSSHTFYGLNPEYFQNRTFNLAHICQTLDYDYRILKKYKNNLTSLKTMIIPISYSSLYSNMDRVKIYKKNYSIYYKIKKNIFDISFNVFEEPLKEHFKYIAEYYVNDKSMISCSNLGWGIYEGESPINNFRKTGILAVKRHSFDITNKELIQTKINNIFALSKMIEWANAKNIEVLLVFPPAHIEYRKRINSQQLNENLEVIYKYVSSNTHTHFINLFSDSDFTDMDFYDADHLNSKGAEKFSKKINQFILNQTAL